MKIPLKIKKMMISLPVERLLQSFSQHQGYQSTPDPGDESDFEEYKPYHLGDDIKRIDWKVYARTEKYFTKRFTSEKDKEICLIFDCSASMGDEASKHYLNTFYFLAYYLFLKNERFGLVLLREKNSQFFSSGSGGKHFQKMEKILHHLEFQGESRYHLEMIRILQKIPVKSEVIFFSDFQNEIDAYRQVFEITKKKNIYLFFVSCFNPNLLNIKLEQDGKWIKDRETGKKIFFSRGFVKDYRKIIFQHYKELKKIFNRRNMRYQELSSEKEDWDNFVSLFR